MNNITPENLEQNQDGTWSESVPLPFYGLKCKCQCGRSFWKKSNYIKHYKQEHTTGKKFLRSSLGILEA